MKDGSAERQRFEALYRTHYRAVAGFVARRLTADAVDDAVSEVFTVAWRRRVERPDSDIAWLLGVASNVAAAHYRTRSRLPLLVDDASLDRARSDDDSLQDAVATKLTVLQVLEELSAPDRDILLLVAWEGLTQSEAAAVLGCSDGAFRVRLLRARQRFRALLERHTQRDERAGRRAT